MDPFTQRMVQRANMRRGKSNSRFPEETSTPPGKGTNQTQETPLNKTVPKDEAPPGNPDRGDRSNTRKIRLQKLALFYAGKKDLSFERDAKNFESHFQGKQPNCKLRRLAELTARINQWEYETSRPKHNKIPNPDLPQTIHALENDIQKQQIYTPAPRQHSSYGHTLSDTHSKQIYHYQMETACQKEHEAIPNNIIRSPLRPCQEESGVSPNNQDNGNHDHFVSSRVALFESGNRGGIRKEGKDPAELSLEERKALFERNSSPLFDSPVFPPRKITAGGKGCYRPERTDTTTWASSSPKVSDPVDTSHECSAVQSEGSLPHPAEGKGGGQRGVPPHGRLYPCLRALDVSEIASSMFSEGDDLNDSIKSNVWLNVSLTDLVEMNKDNPDTPPRHLSFYKVKGSPVINNMERSLEYTLDDLSSLTEDDSLEICWSPPIVKIAKSSSFEYKSCRSDRERLLHTVSFYRKQQQSYFSPQKSQPPAEASEDESILVENKINFLVAEINKQQIIMCQASQALNLCLSRVEFAGSGQQVEGERLLLLASHKRQACLNETQRLKVENRLRPLGETFLSERGHVTLSNITIRLNGDALRTMAATENLHYFVCLIKSDERVLATPVVAATRDNLTDRHLQFPGSVKLEDLFSDFRVTVEVYSLDLSKECQPHGLKCISSKKEKKAKVKKSESRLVKPPVRCPAGPDGARTTAFQLHGYVVFSLRELKRTRWILNKVAQENFLEGALSMNIHSQLRIDEEFRGFLTMFEDISGFGAWHRRWCLLSSHVISFWKYPDDEEVKVPMGTIDLGSVIGPGVGLVPRDICARLNTFQLETTRPRLAEDKNSLVVKVEDGVTTTRHLLSADSKQEMLTWCKKLNAILGLLRSWKCNGQV